MIKLKNSEQIKILSVGGHKLSVILKELKRACQPGATGKQLDQLAARLIAQAGAEPSFKNYHGYPAHICVSLNETIVHGLPTDQAFVAGDIIGIDIGMKYQGLHTDMATTVIVGKVRAEVKRFVQVTESALMTGIKAVKIGGFVSDIGKKIQAYVAPYGYGIVRDLAGHGVGFEIHEDPSILNYDIGKDEVKIVPGMVLAIEPMLVMSPDYRVKFDKEGWNVESYDGSLTAHFEHTIAVTPNGIKILTR